MTGDQLPVAADWADLDQGEVSARVPATHEFVGPMRGLSVVAAAQCGLTVDEIDDLQMAVDEACSLLLPHAGGTNPWLRTRLRLSEGEVAAVVSVPIAPDSRAELDRFGLSWTVLSALADEVQTGIHEQAMTIRLVKRRQVDEP
jgi:serine/threonine-protein kinase RsbW